jgi:hypothetical protein
MKSPFHAGYKQSFPAVELSTCKRLSVAAVLLLLASLCGVSYSQEPMRAEGAIAVDAYDNLAATADASGAVKVYDSTNASRPALISTVTLPRTLTGVALAGKYLLASGQSGVEILDISNPKSPVVANTVSLEPETTTVKAAGNLGYTAVGSTIVVFDIATGEILDRHAYSALPVDDLALSGDYLYAVSADPNTAAGFHLLKLRVEGHLGQAIASWTSSTGERSAQSRLSVYAGEELVYVGSAPAAGGDQSTGVEILQDMGTSFQVKGAPQPIGAEAVRPSGLGLLAYTGGTETANRLGVLDIADPTNTGKMLQAYETAGPANAVVLYHGYAYVAAGGAGLEAIPYIAPDHSKVAPVVTFADDTVAERAGEGNLVRLTASVVAADEISKADFYLNGQKVASDGNYPFEYRFDDAGLDLDDSATVYACAEDIDGNSTCTTPVGLKSKQKSGLRVTAVTPAAGGHAPRAPKLSISAQFSLPLDASTVIAKNVSLVMAATKTSPQATIPLASVTYQAATKTIAIQPKSALASGTYKVVLSSAIKSSSGGAMTADYTWSFAADAIVDSWSSASNGDWSVGANWSLKTPPANGDSVVINIPGVAVTMGTTSGSPAIAGLTVGSTNTLNIAGANLSIQSGGAATISGKLNLSSGSLGGPGTTTVTGTMNWTGGTVSGVLTIPAKAALAINTPYYYGEFLSGGIINNSGTVTQTFGGTPGSYTGFQISSGGTINNLAGGVWNVNGDVWMQATDNSANVFNNAGAFNKIGGTGNSLWGLELTGSGSVNIQSGTLSLSGAYSGALLNGSLAVATGTELSYGQGGTLANGTVAGHGTLLFPGSATISGTFNFAGTTDITGGTVAVPSGSTASLTTLNLSGGTLGGGGTTTVTGTMDWTGGTVSGVLTIPAKAALAINTPFYYGTYLKGGKINNSGTVTQTFGGTPGSYTGFQFSNGGTINNLAGGVWNVNGDVWMQTDTSADVFNNAGSFNKIGGTGNSLWGLELTGSGSVNIQSGTLSLSGPYSPALLNGSLTIATGAELSYGQGGTLANGTAAGHGTLLFPGSATLSGTFNFAGTTDITGGTLAVASGSTASLTTLNLSGGTLGGGGTTTVTGTMDWTGGTVSGVLTIPAKAALAINTPFYYGTYLNGGKINNSGTVTQTFGGTPGSYTGFQFSNGGTINNLAGGVWNVNGDVWMQADSSANVFNNAGSFNKIGGTGTSLWGLELTGSGSVNIQSGTLSLSGPYAPALLNGALTIATGSELSYGQGGTLANGTVAGHGTLLFPGSATLSGTFSFAGTTDITAGTLAVAIGGTASLTTLNLSGGALGGGGTTTVTGTMDWTGGTVSGVLTIPAKAALAINTPFYYGTYLKGGKINNSGTVTQTFAGTPGAYTGFQFSNGGTINNLAGGVWNVTSDVWMQTTDNSANVFNNAGTFNKTGGASSTLWGLPFNNTGTVNINSGSVSLSGGATSQYSFSGTANIATGAVLNYAQQGNLANGQANGAGTLNLTNSAISGTYKITVPAQVSGSTLQVNAGATLNASTLTLSNANFQVEGTTSIGTLNVSASEGSNTGSNVTGGGTINVTDTLNWNNGSASVTGSFNIQNMTLASDSSLTFKLGSSALSVSAKLSLDGTLTLTPTSSNPTVGEVFKVLNFANNFLGDFLDFSLPILGSDIYLAQNLSPTGLSYTVTAGQPPDASVASSSPRIIKVGPKTRIGGRFHR